MGNIKNASTQDLIAELESRGISRGICPACNNWPMAYRYSDRTWHCDGCSHSIQDCTCPGDKPDA